MRKSGRVCDCINIVFLYDELSDQVGGEEAQKLGDVLLKALGRRVHSWFRSLKDWGGVSAQIHTLGLIVDNLVGSEHVSPRKPHQSARSVSLCDSSTTSMQCPRKPNSEKTAMCCSPTRTQYYVGRTVGFSRSLHSSNTCITSTSQTRFSRTPHLCACTGKGVDLVWLSNASSLPPVTSSMG